MSTRSAKRALRRDLLTRSFTSVPLGFKILGGPLDTSNRSIFQMDIFNSRTYGEYFRIWPGARDNEIEVLDADGGLLQVVLAVKEPRRPFTRVVRKSPWTTAAAVEEQARSSGGRILSETGNDWTLELWTPEEQRRFLCGKDDLHYFIAQLPSGDTIGEAHEALKPEDVVQAESLWPGRIQRQGEWFFLPLTDEEAARVRHHVETWPRWPKERQSVGPGGPHIADELVKIDRRLKNGRREIRREEIYARGRVVHPEHRDLDLDSWRRVVRNREVMGSANDRLRLKWID